MSERIAILGAGPMGLEAALYARYLGYDVALYERGDQVATNVARWSHVRLFTPFRMIATPLGVAAIAAQEPDWRPPAATALLTGGEFCSAYLCRLAATDLVVDALQLNQRVLSIARPPWLKNELSAQRAESEFQLLLVDPDGRETTATADIVIDTTGVYGNHNWLGQGGAPAVGEREHQPRIEYLLPDVMGSERDHYAGRHTLVIGSGASAATTVVALAELASEAPTTSVTWVTRQANSTSPAEPVPRIANDRLPQRDQLAAAANALARDDRSPVQHLGGTTVRQIASHPPAAGFEVRLHGDGGGQITVDRIVANVGYHPDRELYAQLQVHECYASEGPIKIAANLLSTSSQDCLDLGPGGADSLVNPEPRFFILGSKSYGRNSQFLLRTGFSQIKQLFTIIGGRDDLDLYATMPELSS